MRKVLAGIIEKTEPHPTEILDVLSGCRFLRVYFMFIIVEAHVLQTCIGYFAMTIWEDFALLV
jgi:hypothetical protein